MSVKDDLLNLVSAKPPIPQQPEKINDVQGTKRPFSDFIPFSESLESDSVKRPRPGLGMGLMSIPKDHTCSGCYCSECDRIDNAAIDSKTAASEHLRKNIMMLRASDVDF